jgi:hypothetical protein
MHKKIDIDTDDTIQYLTVYILPIAIAVIGLIACFVTYMHKGISSLIVMYYNQHAFTMFLAECIMSITNLICSFVNKREMDDE